MGFLTDALTDMVSDPMAVIKGEETVSGRQARQWQIASQKLRDAVEDLDNENYEAATADALVGLLALQLSKS
jgi:hypothetical protein